MRVLKALLLPLLLILTLTLIGVDKLHGPRPSPLLVMPTTPGR